jgi:hypothetical protein
MGRISAQTLIDEINNTSPGKPVRITIEEEFLWGKSIKRYNIKSHNQKKY